MKLIYLLLAIQFLVGCSGYEVSKSVIANTELASTVTPTRAPTATTTPAPTNGPTSTPTPIATSTPMPTATATPMPTATQAPTATSTPMPTATPTRAPTSSPTPMPTSAPFGNSVIEQEIKTLSTGQTKEFPVPTFGNWMGSHEYIWMTKTYYDPVRNNIFMPSKRAQSTGSGMKLVKFDGQRNTWSKVYDSETDGYPLGVNLGHIYESFTVDYDTGFPLFKLFNSKNIATFDGLNWIKYNGAAAATGGWSTPAAATAYHPNLFGIGKPGIVVGGTSSISAYNPETDTVTQIVGGWTSGGYTNAIDYNPIQDCVFITKVNSGEIYRVHRAQSGAVRIADLPTDAGPHTSSTMGRLISTPSGNEVIFEGKGGTRVWRWNPGASETAAGSWTLLNMTNPMFDSTRPYWFPTHMYGKGVYLSLNFEANTSARPPKAILWKPPVGF